MKIKDAAEKYGISSQAIYQRLKRQNIPIDSIKDPESGELTPDALGMLENLFGESSEQFNQRKATANEELARLRLLVQSLEHERDLLRVKLEAAERERDTAKETINKERLLFERLLPGPGRTEMSLFKRLFRTK